MPEEKYKVEEYRNFGGINSKVSPYVTGAGECLDIVNMDFVTPGDLTQRPGTTAILSTGHSQRINGIYDYQQLNGASLLVAGAGSNLYYVNANALTNIQDGLLSGANLSFTTFVDRLFFCNGQNLMKWHGSGSTPYLFSLPSPTLPFTFDGSVGASNAYWVSGTLTLSWGYINDRGFYGAPNASFLTTRTGVNYPGGGYNHFNLNTALGSTVIGGATYAYLPVDLSASYGIGYTVGVTFGSEADPAIVSSTLMFAGAVIYRDRGPGTQRYAVDYVPIISPSGITMLSSGIGIASIQPNARYTKVKEPTCLGWSLMPQFIDVYNNYMMLMGFSGTPSNVWVADLGEPESIQPDSEFEVRTNDGDKVVGGKNYLSRYFIFKQRSFHEFVGDSFNNFFSKEISDQFGAINFRCIIVFENRMLFLDRKGVAEFTGSQAKIISDPKFQDYFNRINLSAAATEAVMVHNRPANQVWIGIPIDGSTKNNITIVYDYLLGSWTSYKGFNPASFAVVTTGFSKETPVYGSYSGMLFNFSASFLTDNGTGFSCLVKTRFFTRTGHSNTELYRRLFLDAQPTSSTGAVTCEFFQDFGSSVVLTQTMARQQGFQSRIDFGIMAKALSVQLSAFSTTDKFILHGIALATRFLRGV